MSIVVKTDKALYETDLPAWRANLRTYIRDNILTGLTDNTNIIDFVSDESKMDIWQAVFTHSSYDLNYGLNYETWEKMGDNVMEVNLAEIFLTKMPNASAEQLTMLINNYLQTSYQGQFGFKQGWTKYMRIRFKPLIKNAEDLVEAVFGALYFIGDQIAPGIGSILTTKLMSRMIEGEEIIYGTGKAPKTELKEIFEKLAHQGVDAKVNVKNNDDGTYTIELLFPNQIKETLNKHLVDYNNHNPDNKQELFKTVIASATDTTFSAANLKAYTAAVAALEEKGFTNQWATRYRIYKWAQQKPENKIYFEALAKANKAGYIIINFGKMEKNNYYVYNTLYGEKEDGSRDILADVTVTSALKSTIRIILLKMYLGQDISDIGITNV